MAHKSTIIIIQDTLLIKTYTLLENMTLEFAIAPSCLNPEINSRRVDCIGRAYV